MVKESKKISSQLMHEENIFFPCSFAVFILPPIGINFGILKRIVLTDHWCSENNFQLNRYFTYFASVLHSSYSLISKFGDTF